MDSYKEADSRIARELMASNLIPGLAANLNSMAFNGSNAELVSIIHNTEADEKKQEMIDRKNKSARGDYYKEYLKACKDPIVMSGQYPATMYRIDPIQQYTTFVYDNNISLQSYINAMGPQWELAWN